MKWPSKKGEMCGIAVIQFMMAVLLMLCACYPLVHDDHAFEILVGIALPSFQEVHLSLLAGFALLGTFARRYMYSSLGLNMLLASLLLQWALLCNGFYNILPEAGGRFVVTLASLVRADLTVVTVLISAGLLLGTLTPLQMVVMGIIETAVSTATQRIGTRVIKATDAGGSLYVHMFGAAFGLAAGITVRHGDATAQRRSDTTDSFAMLGTVFLWCLWPTMNAATSVGMAEVSRCMVNTYLAMLSSTVIAFLCSAIFSRRTRFALVQVQNASLAGGVAVGASCDMVLHPAGAIGVGLVSGFVSSISYTYLQPWLNQRLKLRDARGVVSAHGLPGLLGGLISLVPSWTATEAQYGGSLYRIFEGRLQQRHPDDQELTGFGFNRSAAQQAGCQLLGVAVTLVLALVGGAVTGLVLRVPKFSPMYREQWYNDAWYWDLPEDDEEQTVDAPGPKEQPLTEPTAVSSGGIVGDTLALVPSPEAAADLGVCDTV
ncbi:ammonium transporter Rh type A-like [Schistocerca gregaria]|uniref:ammonium transporter Rh type A-like n=1 Tax=Schistocerca gregaria TaxID=7010 RepID=UPI00211DD2D2|nr:ammonium transporter Rh type A-like [Schistocerca gregaria]